MKYFPQFILTEGGFYTKNQVKQFQSSFRERILSRRLKVKSSEKALMKALERAYKGRYVHVREKELVG